MIRIKVDQNGLIKLPFDLTLLAAEKTSEALGHDIRAAYVPTHFLFLEVSIAILVQ